MSLSVAFGADYVRHVTSQEKATWIITVGTNTKLALLADKARSGARSHRAFRQSQKEKGGQVVSRSVKTRKKTESFDPIACQSARAECHHRRIPLATFADADATERTRANRCYLGRRCKCASAALQRYPGFPPQT